MALIDALKHIKLDELTDKQKEELRKSLQEQRRELKKTITAIDRNLEKLKK